MRKAAEVACWPRGPSVFSSRQKPGLAGAQDAPGPRAGAQRPRPASLLNSLGTGGDDGACSTVGGGFRSPHVRHVRRPASASPRL